MKKDFEELKKQASEKLEEMNDPESIRTPGRTWTHYPEISVNEEKKVSPEIETEGDLEIYTNEEAIEEINKKLFEAVKYDEDRLTALHTANMNSLIYIRAEGEGKARISYSEDVDTFAHVVVDTVPNSEFTLTEEFRNKGIMTSINEIYVGENSIVNYGAVEASESRLTYSRRKAIVEKHGKINWLNSQFKGDLKRTKIETVLKGDNSKTEKLAVWYPTGEQHNDISLHAFHQGENTRCEMNSSAVVDDRARSVYEGLQHVGDKADDTQSFQEENVLMLSDKSEVDASPKLMINDPSVEASHAASTGRLPEDKLHYMKSRGLSEDKARRLFVKSYFEPIIEKISLPYLNSRIREEVEKKLQD